MKVILAAAMASAAFLAAAAPASAQPRPQQCLRNNQLDSFSAIRGDERNIILIDRFRNKYKVGFNRVCDGVDFNGSLAIRNRSNFGLSCVSRGDEVISRIPLRWSGPTVGTPANAATAANVLNFGGS